MAAKQASSGKGMGCLALLGVALAIAFWRWLFILGGLALVVIAATRAMRQEYKVAVVVAGALLLGAGAYGLATAPQTGTTSGPPAATAPTPAADLLAPSSAVDESPSESPPSYVDSPAPAPAEAEQALPEPPAPAAKPAPKPPKKVEATVYATRTGSKYHRDGCRYLKKSRIPMTVDEAKSMGLEP
jgi:hypothetical protein